LFRSMFKSEARYTFHVDVAHPPRTMRGLSSAYRQSPYRRKRGRKPKNVLV
jgi:hypothetical protein